MDKKEKTNAEEKIDVKKVPDDGNVVISKETLSGILERLDSQSKQIDTLTKVADVGRLTRIKESEAAPIGSTVKVWTINGKIVVGWKMTMNDVTKDNKTQVWHEMQNIEFIFEDDSKEEFDYLNGIKAVVKIVAEVLETSKDRYGKESLKVLLPEGKELLIGVEFIN